MINWFKQNKQDGEVAELKKELTASINDNVNQTQDSINEISQMIYDFKKAKYSKHDAFLNLCLFSDIVNIDVTLTLEKIQLAERKQEENLYARVLTVIIIDYLDNINVLMGKDCLTELKQNNMNSFIDEFKQIHKKFSAFKKTNERFLRDTRNNTIAHKSKDAIKLNEHINNLDIDRIYQYGLDMKIYSKEIVDLSTKIMYYIIDYMREGRRI